MKTSRWFISVLIGLGSVIGVLSLLSVQPPSAQAINLSPQANCVASPHSGTLGTQDWCPTDNPHQITDNVIVPAGVTLTLRPGVIVEAASGKRLQVTGVLIGIGTPTEPITLTSSADSGPGQWAGLYLNQGKADLRYVTLRYAGQFNTWGYASINVAHGTLYLENSQIRDSRNVGNADQGIHLCCGDASATISQTQFVNIGDTTADVGVFSNSASDPITVVNSTFQNVAGYPIQTPGESLSRISGNTFNGNAFNRILILGGTPGAVGLGARLSAQTGLQAYELTNGQLYAPPGVTLTVEPGVTLLAQSNTYLHILGHLAANGTPAQPITFTSAADSGPGQWAGVYIQEGSGDLSYLALRYAGQTIPGNSATGAILLQIPSGKPVNLDHVTLRDNALAGGVDYAISINGSHVTLNDSLVTDNGDTADDYAIYLNAGALTTTRTAIQSNAGAGLYVGSGRAALNCTAVYTNGSDGVRLAGSAQFSAAGTAFQANAGAGLTNTGGLTATAIYNWWGDVSGPGGAGPGIGDEVSARVDFTPWLTRPGCGPDLAISKTGPANVAEGERLTYTLTMTNTGGVDATNLIISDTLPVGASYIGGGTLAGNVVTWSVPSLAANGGVTITQFTVTATQTIINSDYRVTADGGVGAIGAVSVTTQVSPVCDQIDGLGFTYTPIVPRVGQSVSFTATITAGALPITYTWSWGDVTTNSSGATVSHLFPVTVTAQTYTVTLTAENACPSPAQAQQAVTVQPHRLYLPLIRK